MEKEGKIKWEEVSGKRGRSGEEVGEGLKEEGAMLAREETRGRERGRPSNCFTRGDSRDVFTRAYVFIAAGTLSAAFKKRTPGLTARGEGNERISLELDDPRDSTNLCLFLSMGMANSERRISFIFADTLLFVFKRFRSINCEMFRISLFPCVRYDFMQISFCYFSFFFVWKILIFLLFLDRFFFKCLKDFFLLIAKCLFYFH